MKIPTVEEIIQTLPQGVAEHGSSAATPHTDVSVCTKHCVNSIDVISSLSSAISHLIVHVH